MSQLALNLLLALVYAFLVGSLTLQSLAFGFLIGYLALALLRPARSTEAYVTGMLALLQLLAVYALELTRASLQLARDIVARTPPVRGAFLRFDASALSPTRTVVLSNLLSLTPGTLTVDIADDGDSLYIHTLYAEQRERSVEGVRRYLELIARIGGDAGAVPPPGP